MKKPQQLITLGIAIMAAMKMFSTQIDPNNPDSVAYWSQIWAGRVTQPRNKTLTNIAECATMAAVFQPKEF